MKYSLTQLLLEDTEFQRIDFGSLPSAEEADKVRLLNTYWYAQKLAGLIIDKIAEKGMEKLYTWGSPSVRRKIEAARAYVKKREEDIKAIVDSTAYCDYIAHLIVGNLKANDTEKLLASVGRPQLDLSPEGSFRSTKKTIDVEDRFGKKYRVTVEEVRE